MLKLFHAKTYFLKHSCKFTIFSYFSWRSILTSLIVVFLTISSSSDSLNFLIATVKTAKQVSNQKLKSIFFSANN